MGLYNEKEELEEEFLTSPHGEQWGMFRASWRRKPDVPVLISSKEKLGFG